MCADFKMQRWQVFMMLLSAGLAYYVLKKYYANELYLGPPLTVTSTTTLEDDTGAAPSSSSQKGDCDCDLLRARIAFLERRLYDSDGALLKAQALYAELYKKLGTMQGDRATEQTSLLGAQATIQDLGSRLSTALDELKQTRAVLQSLEAQCIAQAEASSACKPSFQSQLLR